MQRGFIALISVIIISAILLGVVATASTAGFFSRFTELDGEYKQSSYALAEGCVNAALLQLAQNYSYAPANSLVSIGANVCTIVSVSVLSLTASSELVQVQTKAQYDTAFTTLVVQAQIQNPAVAGSAVTPDVVVTGWQEIP